MHRLLFEKVGDSVYLSHLDLIRVFQRAFTRAGLMLKHSQGFSPKPYVSVALALSVGVESVCELLDFELENDAHVPEELAQRLNATLPAGMQVREVYESDRKTKELTYLTARLVLEYDRGIPNDAREGLQTLFSGESLVVSKHSKKGETETDILPMLRSFSLEQLCDTELAIRCTVCAQNPTLNPMLLVSAIEKYRPDLRPDFASCRRLEILDAEGKTFR